MVFFVVCLLALGLSFFFGLMTGLSGRQAASSLAPGAAPTPIPAAREEAAAREAPPKAASGPSETRLPPQSAPEAASPAAEPTAPAVLQAFEDGAASEPTQAPAAAGRAVASPASGLFVQVASLASRGEAEALSGRLSRHGYRAQIAEAQTPKGRVFRVRVGPYRSEEEAARVAERLRRGEKIRQTWVVRDGR